MLLKSLTSSACTLSDSVTGISRALVLPLEKVCMKDWTGSLATLQTRESRRPFYGFEGTHLYLAMLPLIETFLGIFPDFTNGVRVEKVLEGSAAESAGLLKDDVIL